MIDSMQGGDIKNVDSFINKIPSVCTGQKSESLAKVSVQFAVL